MATPLDLEPKAVAALFGRPSKVLRFLRIDRLTPVQRILVLAAAYLVMLIVGTSIENTVFLKGRSAIGVGLFNESWTHGQSLGFALLDDPVSVLAVAAALLTPLIFFRQVAAIEELVSVHKGNIDYRANEVDWVEVDRATARANKQFAAIGTWWGSAACLVVAMSLLFPLLALTRRVGPLVQFRPDHVSAYRWHHAVHDAWWANSLRAHPLGYLLLDAAGVLLYYTVVKQLAMGAVITNWLTASAKAKFGRFPNLAFNSDGYWGMRVVRRLFQWTYASALLHLSLSLLVITLWLPVGRVTIIVAAVIVVGDGLFVMYPTMTTLREVAAERRAYVAYLRQQYVSGQIGGRDPEDAIERVWQHPMLPFRLRSSASAVILYLLIPTAVAVMGNLLSK